MVKFTASYDRKNNSNKSSFNNISKNLMLKLKCKKSLILDGIHQRTIKTCLSIGMKPKHINVVERNPKLRIMHNKIASTYDISDLWKLLEQKNPYKKYLYDAMILDAVSSIKTTSKNLDNIFGNGYLSDKSVLVFTVTKRSQKGGKWLNDYPEFRDSIQKCAEKYGFRAIIENEQHQDKVSSIFLSVYKN